MTMIEKVARAICVAAGLDPDRKGNETELHWQEFDKEALAAIETLRLHLKELKASPPHPYFWPDHAIQTLAKVDEILMDSQT